MRKRVSDTINKYKMLSRGDGVVIGLSGGADSVCLTRLLTELREAYDLRLYAVHLNHNIRGAEADEDEAFVRRLCNNLKVELFVFSRQVEAEAQELNMTVEEAGRRIRYELFNRVLEETHSQRIAVAHNLNDSAETLLMRLCRGTGIRGLGGILPVRDRIIRPLIEISRRDIEDYCTEQGLDYRTDSTNLCTDYTRNKIRLELLPWLRDNLNPEIYTALNRTAGLLRQEDEYLEGLAREEYERIKAGEALDCSTLAELEPVMARRVVRLYFRSYVPSLKDISAEHIEGVLGLAAGKSGRRISLPTGLTAYRDRNLLKIGREVTSTGYRYELPLDKPVYIEEVDAWGLVCRKKREIDGNLLYTISFNCDIMNDRLYLRTYQSGDKIYLKGIDGNKMLKKLFSEYKISREERDTLPILATDREVLWVMGLKTNDRYKSEEGSLYFYFWRKGK